MPRRYSEKQKARKLSRYHQLREFGKTTGKAAKAVGVSYLTLLKWEKEGGRPGKKAGEIDVEKALSQALATAKRGRKKRAAAPAKSPAGMVLVTPGGYRIEGLSMEDFYRLIEALK